MAATQDFSYLDLESFKKLYTQNGKMQFYVRGIRCSKCVQKLEQLPLRTPGLKSLRVALGENLAEVELAPQAPQSQKSFAAVAEGIEKLGFGVVPLSANQDARKLQRQEDHADLIRLSVAAVCGGNIMMFAVSTYLGLSGELSAVFNWISFLLYLPVVSYVAAPFYFETYKSFLQKRLSIDGPISLASLTGFFWSTYHLWQGKGSIYYDSLSGFLFLILLSRWLQKKLQRNFLGTTQGSELLEEQKTWALQKSSGGQKWGWVPAALLRAGDEMELSKNSLLPLDGKVESNQAIFDLSLLTGESHPRVFSQGQRVSAGAILLDSKAKLLVEGSVSASAFGRMLQEIRKSALDTTKSLKLADQLSQALVFIVFSIAVVFLGLNFAANPEMAVERSLALIILACPCALAFGTPLAISFSIGRAARKGIIIRDGQVFFDILKCKKIFLDKTGTVTALERKILELIPQSVSPELLQVLLSLEAGSFHPIAFAIRKHFANLDFPRLEIQKFREIPGQGVEGFYGGKLYEIKLEPKTNTVALFENSQVVLRLRFSDSVIEGTTEIIHDLKAQGFEIDLISGDQKHLTEKLGSQIGLSPQQCQGDLTPEGKQKLLLKSPDSVMVGDGMNDSLALLASKVGISVSGALDVALKSSRVHFRKPGIQPLTELLSTAKMARQLIIRNLSLSLIYNIVGAALALHGDINPLVAAVLMPISSGLILFNCWIGARE